MPIWWLSLQWAVGPRRSQKCQNIILKNEKTTTPAISCGKKLDKHIILRFGGFHGHGGTPKKMVHKGKTYLEIDDDWGYPNLRFIPHDGYLKLQNIRSAEAQAEATGGRHHQSARVAIEFGAQQVDQQQTWRPGCRVERMKESKKKVPSNTIWLLWLDQIHIEYPKSYSV